MFEFFKNIFSKKNNKKMDTERLINLKENFTGQSFQWVKTKDENLLGKVVKCKDIQPKGRSFIAIFNDGSSIKFLDDDDEIQSFYVTEKEFEELKTSIKSIIEKLK